MLAPSVWIIDNDIVAQFNAMIKIRQAGIHCNIFCFDNAHSALVELMDPEITKNGLPDIILLNLGMPVIDGWDFIEQLGTILNEKVYPDIFLTCYSRVSADMRRANANHMVKGYFVKPITPQNIQSIISLTEKLRPV
ncbi:hypothetical protein LCGC14_2633350 [marine sediment metagenome]|uniref:Response regulator n=2 Tax=root TaxID=1 RepID=A0A831QPU2_9FLAO|nr:response regulator [Pricia antarctica]